jgi:hypothetical protein
MQNGGLTRRVRRGFGGWQESDLAVRHRTDPGKLAIAARLRKETTLPIKWIAARVKIGTPKGALKGFAPGSGLWEITIK